MADETRQVTTGTITDAEQLQRELNVARALVGTLCTSVAITLGNPDDTIDMQFVGVADDTELDNVIAAHPTYTPGLVASIGLTAGAWSTIWTLPIAPGETLTIKGEFTVTIGDASDVETTTLEVRARASRRTAGDPVVNTSRVNEGGNVPQARLRFQVSGDFIQLQLLTQRTDTVTLAGNVNAESELLS